MMTVEILNYLNNWGQKRADDRFKSLGIYSNKIYINNEVSLSYNLFGSLFANSEMRTWKTQADAIF